MYRDIRTDINVTGQVIFGFYVYQATLQERNFLLIIFPVQKLHIMSLHIKALEKYLH